MQRNPAVSGQFYSGTSDSLKSELSRLIPQAESKKSVKGIMVPHAGYVYSGATAGKIYGAINIPSTVLILGPNHHGRGYAAALYPEGEWFTPLGSVKINAEFNKLLLKNVPLAKPDAVAHQFEHSLEVQLPFIQYLRLDVTISALCLGDGDFQIIERIGKGIAKAIRSYREDVLIVASSDMTHYESSDSAKEKDGAALEHLLAFDPEGLLKICHKKNITMCGVVPTAIMLVATKELGATNTELLAYSTSGEVNGDNSKVVGYASAAIW